LQGGVPKSWNSRPIPFALRIEVQEQVEETLPITSLRNDTHHTKIPSPWFSEMENVSGYVSMLWKPTSVWRRTGPRCLQCKCCCRDFMGLVISRPWV
jgi:hypothetical protein